LTVNCFVAETKVQFAKLARTTQLYRPEERPAAGPVHVLAFAAAEQMSVEPVVTKTSYPITPLVGDGDQLKVIGVLSF
jgi:hypothetical protein